MAKITMMEIEGELQKPSGKARGQVKAVKLMKQEHLAITQKVAKTGWE